MQSFKDKVITSLSKRGRGTVFFPSSFSHLAQPDTMRVTLNRLVQKGTIIRVAQGIFCYPKIDKDLGLGVLYPTFEEVAQAIARREGIRLYIE